MTPWERIKPWAGPLFVFSGLGLAISSAVRKDTAAMWVGVGLALFGAWLCDPPGTDNFITLILRIVPWTRGVTVEQPTPHEVVVQVPSQAGQSDTPAQLDNSPTAKEP